MVAADELSYEEARAITEFMNRTFFRHLHLYQFCLQNGHPEQVHVAQLQLETPMKQMPLGLGCAVSLESEWVEGGTIWQGLFESMFRADRYYGQTGSCALRERGSELQWAMAWTRRVRDSVTDPCGSYSALAPSSIAGAVTELGLAEEWFGSNAPEVEPEIKLEDPEAEPEEPTEGEEGEQPPKPVEPSGPAMKHWMGKLKKLEFKLAIELASAIMADLLGRLGGDGSSEVVLVKTLEHGLGVLRSRGECEERSWESAVVEVLGAVSTVVSRNKAASETMLREWIELLGLFNEVVEQEEEQPANAEQTEPEPVEQEPEQEQEQRSEQDLAQEQALHRQQEAQAQLKAAQELVLSMRSKIAELKGYSVQPANSQVVRGVFQLLGERASDVAAWGSCRRLLGADLFTKISAFDPTSEPLKQMSMVAKIKGSLEGVEQSTVDEGSVAVGGMYTWLVAGLEAIEAAAAAVVAEDETPEDIGDAALELDEKMQALMDAIGSQEAEKFSQHFDPKLATLKQTFCPPDPET
eukprot:TRINITY_DN4932_c0_g1_i2.p1 TRINITY_DN4932_c0_g1~~TRINITY_DN4932_c0_g1_i2.p1  ORF type:complete len:524 (-),score=149.41 TRINITY_DN4932_c0_g1_i2:275-1846(-)